MTHRFPIKDIAQQAGLSTATVDRVINGRAHVSPQSQARVRAALDELQAQENMLAARGRRVFLDVVIEAPERFGREVEQATLAILPRLAPVVVRARFTRRETMTPVDCAATLDRIGKRGTQGVILKARDVPEVRAAVDRLQGRGIPVVCVFTDIANSARIAYCGVDNHAAGRTAAWLVDRFLGAQTGAVLTTLSQSVFQGEEARYRGFVDVLRAARPETSLIDVSGAGGLNTATSRAVEDAITGVKDISAVYSMGGGNRAVLAALERQGHRPSVFVAHDLDSDNRALLEAGRLSVVLNHDLQTDMHEACRQILAAQRIIPNARANLSLVQIITPMNLPEPLPKAAATTHPG